MRRSVEIQVSIFLTSRTIIRSCNRIPIQILRKDNMFPGSRTDRVNNSDKLEENLNRDTKILVNASNLKKV